MSTAKTVDKNVARPTEKELLNTFPGQIYAMLERSELSHIVSWLPHGESFMILKQKEFAEQVLPVLFPKMKFQSFKRKMNAWGFSRNNDGFYQNSLYHPDFKRNDPARVLMIKRQKPQQKRSDDTKEKKSDMSTTSYFHQRSGTTIPVMAKNFQSTMPQMSYLSHQAHDQKLPPLRFVSPVNLEDGVPTAAATVASTDDYNIFTLTDDRVKKNLEQNAGPQMIEHNSSEIALPPSFKLRPPKDYASLPVDPELPQIMSLSLGPDLPDDSTEIIDGYGLDDELVGSFIGNSSQVQDSATNAMIEKRESVEELQGKIIALTQGYRDEMNRMMSNSFMMNSHVMVQTLGQQQKQLMLLLEAQQKLINKVMAEE